MQKRILIIIILFLAITSIRLFLLLPTTKHNYVANFRIGTQPTSDALFWLDSAHNFLEARKCDGRPILPLFLTILIRLFKNNFFAYGIVFLAMNTLAFLF
ncbi:MAG: hypothetical protein MUF05_07315, partial [Candidatus Omnitrophica bacterium]|nr:hypothetical protein [Candidatus Omnitrophota bacterium]